jgi:hypothetical protein
MNRAWMYFKYLIYAVGYSFFCAWMFYQNYSVVKTTSYWDLLIVAFMTMSGVYVVWLIGLIAMWLEFTNERKKEDCSSSTGV